MAVVTKMGSIILPSVINVKGTTARGVGRLRSVGTVIILFANIASKTKNVTNAKICCVQDVFGMIVMNAHIVVYYTVTTATMVLRLP